MQDEQQNTITVRVWTSGFNPNHPGESVGHVSLQTSEYYMSLWPRQAHSPQEQSAKESEGWGAFGGISHEFLASLETDERYEQRRPEYIVEFNSLDVAKIDRKFEELKQSLTGWALLPGLCDNAESCASLAWELLKAGEIKQLASSSAQAEVSSKGSGQGFFGMFLKKNRAPEQNSSHASSFSMEMALSPIVKSPDSLVELLKKAKAAEEAKFPQANPHRRALQ